MVAAQCRTSGVNMLNTKRKSTTLKERVDHAQAQHRWWIDEQAEPYPTAHFWCGASLELDYSQGRDMTRRLNTFVATHDGHRRGQCRIESEG